MASRPKAVAIIAGFLFAAAVIAAIDWMDAALESFFITRDWLKSASGIAICTAFLFALSRDRVLRYFNEDRGGPEEL